MSRTYSLAYLAFTPLVAPDAIRIASLYGAGAIGVRLLPAAPGGPFDDLIANKALMRETKSAMAQTGVSIFDIEIVRIKPEFNVNDYTAFLETGAELGAKAILVAGDDPDQSRFIANYAKFCQAAAPYHLTADLEFMPWTEVKNANAAIRVLEAAQQPNAGILVDSLHVGRSETTNDDIRAIPREWLHYAQVCDATAGLNFTLEELIYNARVERFLPGEGNIDIAGMLAALPPDLPLSIEIPSEPRKPVLGVMEWCRLCVESARRLG